MWENTVGLVTFRDPFAANIPISKGGTLPLALPKLIIIPRGFKQSKDPGNVDAPTESITASTPAPLVISFTSFTKSWLL